MSSTSPQALVAQADLGSLPRADIPFGFLQLVVIVASSYAAYRFKTKSWIFAFMMMVVVAGVAILYALPHTKANQGGLLAGYYLIAFVSSGTLQLNVVDSMLTASSRPQVFAANPLIVSWMSANMAGQTKKAAAFTAYNAFSSVGNILGQSRRRIVRWTAHAPIFILLQALTYSKPKMLRTVSFAVHLSSFSILLSNITTPADYPGLRAVLGIFVALIGIIALQVLNLTYLNKRKESQRVKNGMPAKLKDLSMTRK